MYVIVSSTELDCLGSPLGHLLGQVEPNLVVSLRDQLGRLEDETDQK